MAQFDYQAYKQERETAQLIGSEAVMHADKARSTISELFALKTNAAANWIKLLGLCHDNAKHKACVALAGMGTDSATDLLIQWAKNHHKDTDLIIKVLEKTGAGIAGKGIAELANIYEDRIIKDLVNALDHKEKYIRSTALEDRPKLDNEIITRMQKIAVEPYFGKVLKDGNNVAELNDVFARAVASVPASVNDPRVAHVMTRLSFDK